MDDPALRAVLGLDELAGDCSCPFCNSTKAQRNSETLSNLQLRDIEKMVELGADSLPFTDLYNKWMHSKNKKKAQAAVVTAHFNALHSLLTIRLGPINKSNKAVKDAFRGIITKNEGMKRPPTYKTSIIFFFPCALHIKLCISRLLFKITQHEFDRLLATYLLHTCLKDLNLQYLTAFLIKEEKELPLSNII